MKTLYLFIAATLLMLTGTFANAEYPDEIYKPEYVGNESSATSSKGSFDKSRCTYNGISLYGKVKVVTSFPDIKVKVVESFPDLKVKTVTSFPSDCGKWKFVESFPDFTIQYVESFPDIKIKFVESFPGT